MMKAVRLLEFGGPDKLRYGDYPLPDVGPADVLVKVLATSVSRWDIKYRTGEVHEFYGKSTGHTAASAVGALFRCRCSSAATSLAKSRQWAQT
jgi:NADPH:quinone reductase-like Zn-dependent oxidoreductase